jgi:nucleoid-associated protein YgaU
MNVTATRKKLDAVATSLEASRLPDVRDEASITKAYRAAKQALVDVADALLDVDAVDVLDDTVLVDRTIVDAFYAARWRYDTSSTLRRARVAALSAARASREVLDGVNPGIVHVVVEGDTLQKIARRYMGDFELWPRIASYNRLVAPFTLTAGQTLRIPDVRR